MSRPFACFHSRISACCLDQPLAPMLHPKLQLETICLALFRCVIMSHFAVPALFSGICCVQWTQWSQSMLMRAPRGRTQASQRRGHFKTASHPQTLVVRILHMLSLSYWSWTILIFRKSVTDKNTVNYNNIAHHRTGAYSIMLTFQLKGSHS